LPPKEKKPIVAVPYTKGLFEKLKYACRDDFVLVAKSGNTLKRSVFSVLKDKTPKLLQSNLVYSITCECEVKYVGESLQHLKDRKQRP
jgi:hypothetical protein